MGPSDRNTDYIKHLKFIMMVKKNEKAKNKIEITITTAGNQGTTSSV